MKKTVNDLLDEYSTKVNNLYNLDMTTAQVLDNIKVWAELDGYTLLTTSIDEKLITKDRNFRLELS